ncbi:uncharacterized protein FOMMEDRAFT_169990 [Fomitiporia mediterranea MF3/22]|uniref:uncharacterized protein n=1 Tax=Fomitiporia mediterranea (strain MF3/22) TaxID=694068 RepID=UPI0004407FD0|nr:uncharacterized protein FOMMEDRAFT_169990 [Fomitiporia mediterranea MF3/22]EJD00619.1 hypothetical protein FOMMEDRAFT_169990 [Fomitiporia mediterranea MF3/22]
MSIRDRLRPSSTVISPSTSQQDDAENDHDGRVVTGVVLSCDDTSNEGDVHREYKLIRGVHRTVDFVRATLVHPSGHLSVGTGGSSRATFSSPVMSRRHARITLAEDGSVTVMDVGSMHGTYLEGVNFCDFFPERLKPRRHYSLRSGDILLLGKSVTRDDRDWKPVTIRVSFTHDPGARFATPPPNRYGLYVNSAGESEQDADEDAVSISSSSGGEDDDSRGLGESSPDTSPVVSHVPLPLDGAQPSASTSSENLVSISRNADSPSPSPGPAIFDLNRTLSARIALRSMLPPLPSIQLSSIRRLPSLRELGFFRGPSNNVNGVEQEADGIQALNPDQTVEQVDIATNITVPSEPANFAADIMTSIGSVRSPVADEDAASGSIFVWQEPSHPQNQLGLELSAHSSFVEPEAEKRKSEDRSCSCESDSSCHCSDDAGESSSKEQEKYPEVQHDDEKSMEISPCSSRGGSPSFRASAVFEMESSVECDSENDCNGGFEGRDNCQCPSEERPGELGLGREQPQEARTNERPIPIPFIPGLQIPAPTADRTPTHSARQETQHEPPRAARSESAITAEEYEQRRRARAARFGLPLSPGPFPPSPVSVSRRGGPRGSRHGVSRGSRRTRFGSLAAQAGPSLSQGPSVPRSPPDVDVLRTKVHLLENRMQEIATSTVLANNAAASASASTSASVTSIDEARKEMESMREEMRRLSGLLESLVAKIDARAKDVAHAEQGVQAEGSEAKKETASEASLPTSRKRKRVDDLCTLGTSDLETERLIMSLSSQMRRPLVERIREFHEPIEQPEVRPAKRARMDRQRSTMTFAAAAGYTGLGAALAWAALAYVL